MEIFGRHIPFTQKITNEEKKARLLQIERQELYREIPAIQGFRDAMEDAEDEVHPNNEELMRIYQELVLDPHVTALIDTIKHQICSNKFNVFSGEEVSEEKTNILRSPWFTRWMELVLEAEYYGFSLIQFGEKKENTFNWIKSVPREYVIPQRYEYKKRPEDYEGKRFDRGAVSNWTMFVGDERNLGLLSKSAPLVIYKIAVTQYWASFNEIFGQPFRFGRTDLTDEDRKQNMVSMMENMSFAPWAVGDKDDVIEFMSGNIQGEGQNTYNEFIRMVDEQNSKLFAGQTMVLDNGASRSQSETHERNMLSYTNSKMRNIKYMVDTKLVPFLINLGFPFDKNDKFEWQQSENVSLIKKAGIIRDLAPYVKFNKEHLEDTLDIVIDDVYDQESNSKPGILKKLEDKSVMSRLEDYYKFLNKIEE